MILASQSPRRRELLESVGFWPRVLPADINEEARPGETARALVQRLAEMKAHACADAHPELCKGELVLAADTVVWLDELSIFGKPHSHKEAYEMLTQLAGRSHQVTTGVCLLDLREYENPLMTSWINTAEVSFYPLSSEEIERYISTGEPFDKAGGYGIQGLGRLLVSRIVGDFYTIVGLPIAEVARKLAERGVYPKI